MKISKIRYLLVFGVLLTLLMTKCVENHLLPNFGSIKITSDPLGAKIYLNDNNESVGETPDSLIELMSGDYTIKLTSTGFIDTSFTVQLDENKNLSYDIFMKEANPNAKFTLTSDPSGAQIFINGINTEKVTPSTFSNLERGIYSITLKLNLYDDYQFQIDLARDETIQKNTKMIVAGTAGGLFVTSNPSGASIFLDGFNTGLTTPDSINPLAPGNYSIKLALTSYRDTTIIANVLQGQITNSSVDLTFYEPRGSIELSSNPSGAKIYLNEVDQAIITPGTLKKLEAGNYQIKLELENYYDTLFTVNVAADRKTTVPTVQLIKIPYLISVTINPPNSGTVDGAGGYDEGESVTLLATPATGYNFVSWMENGSILSSNSPYQFTASKDRNLVANFVLKTYTISAVTFPSDVSIIDGTGVYSHGDSVHLTVTEPNGYKFVNWTEDGSEVSTSINYSFMATSDRSLVANFNPIGNLSVNSDPQGANIYLNSSFTGQLTPHTFENILADEYSVTLQLDDFADTTIVIDVFPGQTTNLGTVILRDITPDVEVAISHNVDQGSGRIIFTFIFNQDIRFDRVNVTTPTNLIFPQNYGGVLLPKGIGITWTYAEEIKGAWTFNFEGRKVGGRQSSFNISKNHQVN